MGYEAAAPSDPRKKYGTYERDDGTGLDYAQARYYQSRLGRFTSVDPLLSSAKKAFPQSWNRYAYAYNNPNKFTDPTGEEVRVLDKEALKYIRKTLPPEVRDKIKLDKNKFIDKRSINMIESQDQNLLDLRMLVNSNEIIEIKTSAIVKGTGRFEYKSVETVKKELIKVLSKNGYSQKDIEDIVVNIKEPSSFLGYTLVPSQTSNGNIHVIISNRTGAASSAPEEEIVVTVGHELYGHVALFIQGKAWEHDSGGPVDAHIKEVESRTRINFSRRQQVTSHQQPK